MAPSQDIVLYHYPFSPYAKRVTAYLALRGIPYKQCLQPMTLPRPDMTALGISYRRIPILSTGKDFYLDTRLILQKLSALFPDSNNLAPTNATEAGVEALLSHYMISAGIFRLAASLLPPDLPLLKDPKFQADRSDYTGTSWTKEAILRARPEALAGLLGAMQMLETTLLADGREWIAGGKEVSGADIEGAWVFSWILRVPGAVPEESGGKGVFPKVWAWVERYERAVKQASGKMEKPRDVKGEEVARTLEDDAKWAEEAVNVDGKDPLGLKGGEEIVVYPTDSGNAKQHRDIGKLVGLSSKEVVIEKMTKNGVSIRVHAPRVGFRAQKVGGAKV